MLQRSTRRIFGAIMVGLFVCQSAFAQALDSGGLPTLGVPLLQRPEFGGRPSGQGFRPSFSPARPGLLRQSGLQDAMQSARNSPLERALNAPAAPVVVVDPRITQAFEALGNMRDVQRQQLTAQTSRRGRSRPQPAYVARFSSDVPVAPNASAIEQRLQQTLARYESDVEAVTVRHEGDLTVLEGTVATERQRRVTEHLLRLEPGVYEVENRLRVMPRKD